MSNILEVWKCTDPSCKSTRFDASYKCTEYHSFDNFCDDHEIEDSYVDEGPFNVVCHECNENAVLVKMTEEEFEKFFGIGIPSYLKKKEDTSTASSSNNAGIDTSTLPFNNPFEVISE